MELTNILIFFQGSNTERYTCKQTEQKETHRHIFPSVLYYISSIFKRKHERNNDLLSALMTFKYSKEKEKISYHSRQMLEQQTYLTDHFYPYIS